MIETITWAGLDAHKKFINVAVKSGRDGELHEWKLANTPQKLRRFARKLIKMPGVEVRCCYEAGPCGFALQRALEEYGEGNLTCDVVAPSLIPVKPGDRVKTNRRDARKLLRAYSADMLTKVHPPSTEQEAERDLFRCREALRDSVQRARHRLGKFLLRRSLVYSHTRSRWTQQHRRWLHQLRFDQPTEQRVFDEYLALVEDLETRLQALDQELEEIAQRPKNAPLVNALKCFHGIKTLTAIGIVVEIYDIGRFASPRGLMAYLGIVPSEHSTGDKARRGGITKTGNSRVRRLLTEAAWHYRRWPKGASAALRKRRKGQPRRVVEIAEKARLRLPRRYSHLVHLRNKHPNKATTAVARELVGFIWAALRHVEHSREDNG